MGIPGLSTFLSKYHSRYHETLLIRDSLVVIDGNNLMHFLLTHPRGINSHLVGGDWILYSKTVREFFQHLKNCQITPIVIFDGVLEPEKFNTKFRRFKDTIKDNVHQRMPGSSYTPAPASAVFVEILIEQRVLHYQTEFECDDTLAYVAGRLDCPLLSSDSDFYIYPRIKNIPLSAIDFRTSLLKKGRSTETQKKVHVLSAKVLALEKLCNTEFKFKDLRFLPLAAVIMGNDRISAQTFGNVLKSKAADRDHRIKYILEWLGRHKDYDRVLGVILQTVKESERPDVLKVVKSVLQNYNGDNGELKIWNTIVQDLELPFDVESVCNDGGTLDPPGLPLELHIKCKLHTWILQIQRNHLVFLQPQVEMTNMESTHNLSLDVVRTIAGILLGESTITLFTRQRKNAVRVEVSTITKIQGYGDVPTIRDASFRNKGILLVYQLFGFSEREIAFTQELPSPLRLVVGCLIYFLKKASGLSIVRPMAIAILMIYFKTIFQSNQICAKCQSPSSVADLVKKQGLSKEVKNFFQRFEIPTVFSKTHPYNISFAYVYSQFQCLLVHTVTLNRLLGNPFRVPKLGVLHPHFVYNVIEAVVEKYQKNTQSFLGFYFQGDNNSHLLEIFDRFFNTTSTCNNGREILQGTNRSSSESMSDEEEEDASDIEVESVQADFISNRFRKLAVQ